MGMWLFIHAGIKVKTMLVTEATAVLLRTIFNSGSF